MFQCNHLAIYWQTHIGNLLASPHRERRDPDVEQRRNRLEGETRQAGSYLVVQGIALGLQEGRGEGQGSFQGP